MLIKIKRFYHCGPFNNPSVFSPDALGCFIIPLQWEVVIRLSSSSLFLMIVRVIIERGT
jgi:hypothetical protein